MNNFHLAGLNIWSYSCNRAVIWIGGRESHWGEKKRHATYERGPGGDVGIEIIVGGESREVMFRIGLLLATFYIGLTNVVPDKYEKAKTIAEKLGRYGYEVDFSSQGRRSGVMLSFGELAGLEFSLWVDDLTWTRRGVIEKFRCFPYCEGIRKKFYWRKQ